MTDFSDDELASAYLDDQVTPEERARVEGDSAVMARVAELRGARDALAAEPIESPSPTARDNAIRAAVRAGTTADLAEARAARATRTRQRLRVASIAAAILVALGLTAALLRIGSDSSNQNAATSANSATPTTAGAPSADRAAGAEALSGSAGTFLGSFADQASLVDAARATLAARDASKDESTPAQATAAGGPAAGPLNCNVDASDAVETVLTEPALLDGRSVRVDVVVLNDGSRLVVVTDDQTCDRVFSQRL
jgi:hypothetical protein